MMMTQVHNLPGGMTSPRNTRGHHRRRRSPRTAAPSLSSPRGRRGWRRSVLHVGVRSSVGGYAATRMMSSRHPARDGYDANVLGLAGRHSLHLDAGGNLVREKNVVGRGGLDLRWGWASSRVGVVYATVRGGGGVAVGRDAGGGGVDVVDGGCRGVGLVGMLVLALSRAVAAVDVDRLLLLRLQLLLLGRAAVVVVVRWGRGLDVVVQRGRGLGVVVRRRLRLLLLVLDLVLDLLLLGVLMDLVLVLVQLMTGLELLLLLLMLLLRWLMVKELLGLEEAYSGGGGPQLVLVEGAQAAAGLLLVLLMLMLLTGKADRAASVVFDTLRIIYMGP